jgi:hypothetical protein
MQFNLNDPGAIPAEPDPGSERHSTQANDEAPDDTTGLGSEFQQHRLEAQARVPEGLDGK